MPGNYKETNIAGSCYTRAFHVTISNRLNERPYIQFDEEQVTTLTNGQRLFAGSDQLQALFDPAAVVEVLNPETDEPVGMQVTHGQLYAILYSIYKQLAVERDLRNTPLPPNVPVDSKEALL